MYSKLFLGLSLWISVLMLSGTRSAIAEDGDSVHTTDRNTRDEAFLGRKQAQDLEVPALEAVVVDEARLSALGADFQAEAAQPLFHDARFNGAINFETLDAATPEFTEAPIVQEPIAQAEPETLDVEANSADLAQQSQNPIASLISVPFENNINFGVGQFDNTGYVLNLKPVVPVALNAQLSLVNRLIAPLAYQPELARIEPTDSEVFNSVTQTETSIPGGFSGSIGDVFGLGDLLYQGFFVPQGPGKFTWGVGPGLGFPTATDRTLGTGKWLLGANAVGLVTDGPIVAGALVSQLWSYAGDSDRNDVSLFSFQPFFNYNLHGGWYLSSAPTISANWLADSDDVWTLPIGGGGGRVFNIGKQPVNMALRAYWNAIRPDTAADWTLQFQVTLLFPRSR